MDRRDRFAMGAAVLGIFGLTGAGFVLSYSNIVVQASRHGYDGWQSWLWAATPDALVLSATLLGLTIARRGYGPRGEAWAAAGLAVVVTLAANMLGSWGDPIAVAMHAWPALCLALSWHLLFRTVEAPEMSASRARAQAPAFRAGATPADRHGGGEEEATPAPAPALVEAPAEDIPEDTPEDVSSPPEAQDMSLTGEGTRPAGQPARARLRVLLRRYGADLDASTVAERLGVSRRHAARLLREARKVGEAAA